MDWFHAGKVVSHESGALNGAPFAFSALADVLVPGVRPSRVGRPAHARSAPRRRDLKPHPVGVVPPVQSDPMLSSSNFQRNDHECSGEANQPIGTGIWLA
jgi:hypothetical protein